MLRTGLKFPVTGLNLSRIKRCECERFYLPTKGYSTKSKGKCDHRLLKDFIPTSRLYGHRYSTESRSGRRGGGGTLITFGAVTVGAIGILAYARTDPQFRIKLDEWIPGTDKAITIIFQEQSSYFDYILELIASLKDSILEFFKSSKNEKEAPRPAFDISTPILQPDKPKPEIRLSKERGEKVQTVSKKPSPPEVEESVSEELKKMEKYAGELAAEAIAAFKDAACAVQNYNKDIHNIIESSDGNVKDEIWNRLKAASQKKIQSSQKAERKADEVFETLKKVQSSIDEGVVTATTGQKTIARRNIAKILGDVDNAKKGFEQELANADISEKYWRSIKSAREKFTDELTTLFPQVNLHEKKLSINDETFDVFVLHMYHKLSFLQKELEKMQTVAEAKLKSALRSGDNEEVIKEAIELEVSKERRKMQENFDMKILSDKKEMDDEMRKQLKLQAQIHADHLHEVLATKERETERQIKRALSERKEDESTNTKAQLASVIGKLRGLDEALKHRLDAEKDANEAQLMWGACQALGRAVKAAPPGTSPEKSVRPLELEIKAIVKSAPKNDPFVQAAIGGIPQEAVKRGVYPEDALRERFLQVEKMARKLALVPEDGASLPVYLLSYLQSFLLVKAVSPIPKHELDDEPIDVDALSTYDVLQRARYWLDRGDFKMTLRYMNLLKGAPRSVARDWMNETRILLETQQAIESLIAYAGAGSLVFMGGGEPKDKKK